MSHTGKLFWLCALMMICGLLSVFLCCGLEEAAADSSRGEKEKSQLQEELGVALRDYYIYGDNYQECTRLLRELDEKN